MLLDYFLRRRFTRKILLTGCKVLSLLNNVLPKFSNWIFFCESVSCEFHDNSRAVYDYLVEHKSKQSYKFIIAVTDTEANKHLKKENTIVVGRVLGIVYFLFCKYCFYSYSFYKIKPAQKQVVVNQWHGTPLKAIGAMSKDVINAGEKNDNFTYILSTAPMFYDTFEKAFECDRKKILCCGHARTDIFFESISKASNLGLDAYSKAIIWMPTFRTTVDGRHNDLGKNYDYKQSETLLPLFDTIQELEKLNCWLNHQNILLIIKIHSISPCSNFNFTNIKLYKDVDLNRKGITLYELIKEMDALITDYSSVFFDFLLLNRPIGFTVDDISLYQNARGFTVENPLELMPGHHIETIQEFYEFIQDIISGKDLYYQDRKRVNDLCNRYQDNHNCQRLLEQIGL